MIFNVVVMNKNHNQRKISKQKVFSAISAGYIIACCIFYGTKFIKLYFSIPTERPSNLFPKTLVVLSE